MEKREPHSKLAFVKALVKAGKVRATLSALAGGAALGINFEEMVGIVSALTPKRFLQQHDYTCRPYNLARRVSPGNAGWKGLSEIGGYR